ncbi:hypothetical protein E5676_scaffold313G00250 [Cucumis melo var. makuwa]|uniref:Uncharacterized protein n=1 Tax=Cucumis melo var. makuwa TaxID=1194695 RepID=A0A5D3DSD7_CUCMM|nr:hypothetical protein E5676_scaffold313G00250 [Cucumis melo var. makuwa]
MIPKDAHISLVIPKDTHISLVILKDAHISLVIPKDTHISQGIPKDTVPVSPLLSPRLATRLGTARGTGCVGWRTEEKEVGEGSDWIEEEQAIEGRDGRQSTGCVRQRGGSEMGRPRTTVCWRCEADDFRDGETTTETEMEAAVCRNEEQWRKKSTSLYIMKEWKQIVDIAQAYLEKASKCMKSGLIRNHQDLNDKQRNDCVRSFIDLKHKEDREVEEILAE